MSFKNRKNKLWKKNQKCYWCDIGLKHKTATVDHLKPLALGGSKDRCNTVLSCGPCNFKKGLDRWYKENGKIRIVKTDLVKFEKDKKALGL